jgi:tRNA(Ile)-lysidine synthase
VTKALTGDEFDACMAPLGPFAASPLLAVAVSGGADSMALAVLAKAWAERRKGRLLAFTVDHGLRVGSTAEAKLTGRRLRKLGITHHILTWQGAKPVKAVQERAREARYRLLGQACRKVGARHLLVAHTQEDQAETFLLRLARGSGVDGLSAMAPVTGMEGGLRLLRPLLDVPKARLVALLRGQGIEWAEDPSNQNEAYERIRLRKAAPQLEALGLSAQALARSASRLASARQTLDAATGRLLSEAVELHPAGYALAETSLLQVQDHEILRRALSQLVVTVGGREHPPAFEALERLAERLAGPGDFRGASLGGCRIAPWRGRLLIARAAESLPEPVALKPGSIMHWDGRFSICLQSRSRGIVLAPLGAEGARNLAASCKNLGKLPIPAAVRPSLPCLLDAEGVSAVPHLGYNRRGQKLLVEVGFLPLRPLFGFSRLA